MNFSGKRSRQILIGGRASLLLRLSGHCSSVSASALSIAFSQRGVFSNQRARRPMGRNTFSRSRFVARGAVPLARAMVEIARSERTRPGEISRWAARSSRASQSDFTTASWLRFRILCIPDVRRHGSMRLAAGGAARIAENSCSAHFNFFFSTNNFSISSRSSTRSSTSRAA